MKRTQLASRQSRVSALPLSDPFADPLQLTQARALVTQKAKRRAELIQHHYRAQSSPQHLSAADHEQLFHLIELTFHQLQDWPTVINCVLSADTLMQRRAIVERWRVMIMLAIDATRSLADRAAEAELTLRLGMLLDRQGQLRAASTCLAEAERLFAELGLPAQLRKTWHQQAEQWIRQGNYSAAHHCLAQVESQTATFTSANEQIELYCTWGLLTNAQGNPQAALAWYEKALAVAASAPMPDVQPVDQASMVAHPHLGLAHERLGRIYSNAGDYATALIHLTAAQQSAEAAGDDLALGRILSLIGTVWGLRGQLHRSIDYFQQIAVVAERSGLWALSMTAHSNLAVSHYRLGEFTQALRAIQRSVHWSKQLYYPTVYLNSLVNQCEIHCALNQPDAAQVVLAEAETLLATLDHTPKLVAFVDGARGRLAVLNGDSAGAIHHFLAAAVAMQATENRFEAAEFAIELVPLYLAQQDWGTATTWIDFIHTIGEELPQRELIGQAATLTGDLARAQGNLAAAQAAYTAALTAFQTEENDRNRYLAAQLTSRLSSL